MKQVERVDLNALKASWVKPLHLRALGLFEFSVEATLG
jgi:hypothetical protein